MAVKPRHDSSSDAAPLVGENIVLPFGVEVVLCRCRQQKYYAAAIGNFQLSQIKDSF